MGYDVGFGCECYWDNSSGERICITSFRPNFKQYQWSGTSITMISDHLLLWYHPRSCKQIIDAVEEIKAVNDKNNAVYNPKLTFNFFIDETLYNEVQIEECRFPWIYQEEIVSSIISESHYEEETVSSLDFQFNDPTNFESDNLEETIAPSNLELDETYDLRYPLEELLHIGFHVDHMNTTWLFDSTEEESNS